MIIISHFLYDQKNIIDFSYFIVEKHHIVKYGLQKLKVL